MGNYFRTILVLWFATGICRAQIQKVTRTNEYPDFLPSTTPEPAPASSTITTPKPNKDKEDEARFRAVTGTESTEFWMSVSQSALKERLAARPIEKIAKNIIFFVGDGMSVPTVSAARIYKGQRRGAQFGEEEQLHMEKFPYLGASKTFCSDAQVADSACSATALFTGSKTNFKMIGVSPKVLVGNCTGQMKRENQLSSILEWAQKAGKSTGIVTTTRITHATPAGTYARIAHRDWENDGEVTKAGFNADECDDIAEQLILMEPGKNINVILGGGRKHMLPSSEVDPEGGNGTRNDSKNLIEMWKKANEARNGQYVDTVQDLLGVDATKVDYLLGLFAPDHIEYADNLTMNNDPSLFNMTNKAIQILSKNPNGFFLMVEGGRIDHALHESMAQRALREAVEMDDAVKLADDLTNDEDSLIVVTSDHSHVMTIAGYPTRGTNILEVGDYSEVDGLPYTTISFANGPGHRNVTSNGLRPNVSEDNIMAIDYKYYSGVPLKYETHGGDDVLIFSKGPYSHLLTGVNLQNYIPHVMGYAACIAPEGTLQSPLCNQETATRSSAGVTGSILSWLLLLVGAALSANPTIYSVL